MLLRKACSLVVFVLPVLFACKQKAGDGSNSSEPLFTLLSPDDTHVDFQNSLTEGLNTNILMYEYFYNGGGVATADFNGDGLTDLYFTSNMGDNKLYVNKGKMQFEDVTDASGAGGRPGPWKTGVNAVDINADGKMDIYLCYSGAMPAEKRANQLFINTGNNADGNPEFQEVAEQYGLASTGFSNQSYFFDYDKDGDLDMLLLNHNPKNLPILNEQSTAELLKADSPDKGLRLFKQDKGRFTDITTNAGINGSELSYGLGLGLADFNKDGWPDFYVSNDYSVPDYLYINNGNGTFTNKLSSMIGHTSQFSMGNDVTDVNNDGLSDIFTLDMLPEDNHRQKLLLTPDNYGKFTLNLRTGFYYQYMRNMFQLNNGNGTFSEVGQLANISNTDWSWAPLFADYDNDGWKDLYITNGYNRDYTNLDFINYMNEFVAKKGRLMREDVMEIIKEMPSSNVVNYLFHNKADGTFENKSNDWGINVPSNSNGAVYADLDNDGDLDLIVNNINKPAFIYQNEAGSTNNNHYLDLHLQGEGGNTAGLGAEAQIFAGGKTQLLYQNPTRGYLSSVSATLHFGLGNDDKIDSLLVTWNSGKQQLLTNVKANQVLELKEADAKPGTLPAAAPAAAFFAETTSPFAIESADTSINDFNRQSLLISQFSYNGPCMAKADLNGDGLEDLVIGGDAGQPTRVLLQQAGGAMSPKQESAFVQDKAFADGGIAIFDADGNGTNDLYIASGGYHNLSATDALLNDRLYLNDGKGNFTRKTTLSLPGSKSCVRAEDMNGDGAPDLFVGGRVLPGDYPKTPQSFILVNDGKGNFTDQAKTICPEISQCGMVTDAVWTDLDGDSKNELVVVGEWMPATVFNKQNGKLVNVTTQYFDKPLNGWWNSITVGDVNGDNKPDLVIGNLGINTQFKASEQEPLEMFFGDFDGNGSVDPVFSFYIQHQRYPFITRDELAFQLPVFRKRFSTFASYADITMDQFFPNDELKKASHLQASHMLTTCFLSGANGKFSQAALPLPAQYAPVYASVITDANGDGKNDLLLFGNNSRFKIRLGKMDANYGMLLAGDGKGGFRYVSQSKSGFAIRGDVRSAAFINHTLYLGTNTCNVIAYKLTTAK